MTDSTTCMNCIYYNGQGKWCLDAKAFCRDILHKCYNFDDGEKKYCPICDLLMERTAIRKIQFCPTCCRRLGVLDFSTILFLIEEREKEYHW